MKIANSARLTFRLMDDKDSKLLFQLDQDEEVMLFINGGKCSSQNDIDNIFIPRMLQYRNADLGWGLWQVNHIDSDKYIGWILIRPMNFFSDKPEYDNLEIGWRFFKESWGKGYATEAANHVKSAIMKYNNIRVFSAIADPRNTASINVMKKLGMQFVKTYMHTSYIGKTEVVYYQAPIK